MSRKASPWDNAACESFMKTLKYEEVHRTEYRNLAQARAAIGEFLEKVYNPKAIALGLELSLAGRVRKLLVDHRFSTGCSSFRFAIFWV